jgi:hypothetical protein
VISRSESFAKAFSMIKGHSEPNTRKFSVEAFDAKTNASVSLPFSTGSLEALQKEMQHFPDSADEMVKNQSSIFSKYLKLNELGKPMTSTSINWLHIGISAAVGIGIGIAIGINLKK